MYSTETSAGSDNIAAQRQVSPHTILLYLTQFCIRRHVRYPSYGPWAHESTLARRAKFSHALVWPLELGLRTTTLCCGHSSGPSCTRGGFFDFEVGGHDGAYKGRVPVVIPFVGRKNGKLFDCQQSYDVLVFRVLGLEEGVMFWG